MHMLNRITDILSANLHELIERYEDPELLLKQALREMDDSLRAALHSAVSVVAHEKILARQLADEEAAVAGWRERAEVAVQRGDDQAARDALRHKRDREAASASLARQLEEATAAGQTLRRQIKSMRLRSEDAHRKLALLAARQRAAEARQKLLKECSAAPLGDDSFHKFERMCRKVEQSEAMADALVELTAAHSLSAELAAGRAEADEQQIEAELGALKGRYGA